MESIIDQLRIHDGKLFQNELVLSVYVDFKRLVLNHILLALSTPGGLKVFLDWDEGLEESLVENLLVTEALFDACVDVFCNELHRVPKNPTLKSMLQSMVSKLCSDSFVVSKQILALDPIKQDFIMREIFRRSLWELTQDSKKPAETQVKTSETLRETPEEIPQEKEEKPKVKPEEKSEHFTLPEAESVLPDTISVHEKVSVAPSVLSVTSTMTHKKPIVRKVMLDDDASTVFTASRK